MSAKLFLIFLIIGNFSFTRLIPTDFLWFTTLIFTILRFPRLEKHEKLLVPIVLIHVLLTIVLTVFFPIGKNNIIVFNVLEIVVAILYLVFFIYAFSNKRIKRAILGLLIVFPALMLVNLLFGQGRNVFNTLTIVPLYFLLSLLCYMRIRHLILEDAINRNNIEFWFLLASLFYFVLPMSQMALEPYLNEISLHLSRQVSIIEDIAIYAFNVTIIIGLLWKKPRNTYSLS